MRIHVLGSGAGGGFPQWNCNCDNCAGYRRGEIQASPRTQSSIAVSGDGIQWVLINASPDIRQQIIATPELQPARAKRDSGIVAVVLMDSQIDHTAGLLTLRESSQPLALYCTDQVYQDLTSGFPVLSMLNHYCGVNWQRIDLEQPQFEIPQVAGLRFVPVPLSSKAPPYSPHREDAHWGDNIGVKIEDKKTGQSAFYAPGLGNFEPHLLPYMENADLLLVDGTTWTDDEMQRRGVGMKRASEMGHLAQSGPNGMIELLRPLKKPRKVLIHINNTNPILDENSNERAELAREGIEVAYDGMDFTL
ncbi:MAG: pyrroloquinoline quinone biosynthesis protein PqqB [Pseudomonadota bacterium]|nr:pyrroloquinoline quinone biosynthesis protein PqqB [Pseudomonadota bacterium]